MFSSFLLWLPNLLVALLIAFLSWVALRAILRATRFVLQRSNMDETAIQFILTVERYAIVAIGTVTVLGQVGVDVTSIVASMGILGLTLGFAAKDTLGNVIAGLFIFWDRPFIIGDLVEIDGFYGRVDVITMRSTRVVTPDGKMLAIPNSTIVNATVASYTNFPHLRLDLEVTVGCNEDLGRIRALFLELVADRPGMMMEPAPEMLVMALNDYNVELSFRTWLDNEKTHVGERAKLREDLYVTLRGAGIDMPNEILTINPVELRKSSLA
ncbi:MAG: small conductance mechanosensitive channel [Cognaticolwellia sp.]|jgi:small conductance mechanosensitive channel